MPFLAPLATDDPNGENVTSDRVELIGAGTAVPTPALLREVASAWSRSP